MFLFFFFFSLYPVHLRLCGRLPPPFAPLEAARARRGPAEGEPPSGAPQEDEGRRDRVRARAQPRPHRRRGRVQPWSQRLRAVRPEDRPRRGLLQLGLRPQHGAGQRARRRRLLRPGLEVSATCFPLCLRLTFDHEQVVEDIFLELNEQVSLAPVRRS